MTFWSTEKIKDVAKTWEVVKPFNLARLDCGSYHLTVGPDIFVTATGGKKTTLQPGEQVTIPPGQLAIVVTEERVRVPRDAIGFISMRASIKLGGLVNVSGFHVDPGYDAPLKFSVYNAGDQPTVLMRGDPIFLIWFADLDRPTEYAFKTDPDKHGVITSSDVSRLQGTMPTPTALKTEIERVRSELNEANGKLRSELNDTKDKLHGDLNEAKAKMLVDLNEAKDKLKSWRVWVTTTVITIVTSIVAGIVVWRLTLVPTPAGPSTKTDGVGSSSDRNVHDGGSANPVNQPPALTEPAPGSAAAASPASTTAPTPTPAPTPSNASAGSATAPK